MRKKKLFLNTIASLINQFIVAICGLILPRAILTSFGSEVNGLVSSITQFLGLIAFMELGVGAVAQSAMYKPLANKDEKKLSKIMISARKYFRNIAKIFAIYIFILIFMYPLILNKSFDFVFSGSLIFIIAISSFAEYYFGIVNQQLLSADQKAYIHLTIRSVTQILNTVLCIIFIKIGCTIHVIKLITSVVFLVRPILMWMYVNKNYKIDYELNLEEEPIKQKWNGLAQHIAAVILDKTDVIVLTLFSTLSNVSIYSVYYLVVNNLRQLITSCTVGIQSLIGNLLARNEKEKLNETFNLLEIITHFVITLLFCVCGILIIPFVKLYTRGICDVNYIEPIFAIIIVIANAMYCFRNSYNILIKAAGHYKETQNSAIIEMVINIIISVITVIKFGLIGVAVGTLIAMLYRTVYLVIYLSKNILFRPVKYFIKNLMLDVIIVVINLTINIFIKIDAQNYLQLIILAIIIFTICLLVESVFYLIIYRKDISKLFKIFENEKRKKNV